MKIKYLGTATAERVPAIFCTCEVCAFARKEKGKEIRTQMQTWVDDGQLLIDFTADSYLHQLQHQIDFNQVEHLLLTHWHGDHFYGEDLALRMSGYAQNLPNVLHVYGSPFVKEFYDRAFELEGRFDERRLLYHMLTPYEETTIGSYRVCPIPAQHGHFEADCLIYAIQNLSDGKCLFYGHDTGVPKEADLSFLAQHHWLFDCVSLDCTGQERASSDPVHMSLKENLALIAHMRQLGLIHDQTQFIASHFSHNGGMNFAQMCTLSEKNAIVTSYDGMEVVF